MDRADTTRFLKALDTLVEIGEDWAPEIEIVLKELDAEELADFVQGAGRACGTLGIMVGNLLTDAKVQLPLPVKAARKTA